MPDIGYAILNDPTSANDVFLKSADMYARKALVDAITGVLDISTASEATITPAVSPAWTPAAYDGLAIIIAGQEAVISSSSADHLTFDATSLAGLVNGQTYGFRVLGDAEWLGISDGKSFDVKDDFVKLTTGIPKKTVRKDLLSREVTAKGKLSNQKFTILKALLGLSDASITAAPEAEPPVVGYNIGNGGSNPSTYFQRFEFIFQTASIAGKTRQLKIWYGDIKLDGSYDLDSDKYKELGFVIEAYSDPLRIVSTTDSQDADIFQIKDAT
jgi:hypothetical protein